VTRISQGLFLVPKNLESVQTLEFLRLAPETAAIIWGKYIVAKQEAEGGATSCKSKKLARNGWSI